MMDLLKYAKLVPIEASDLSAAESLVLTPEQQLYFEEMVWEYLNCGFSVESLNPLELTMVERVTLAQVKSQKNIEDKFIDYSILYLTSTHGSGLVKETKQERDFRVLAGVGEKYL